MNFKPGDKVFIDVSQDIYSYTWGRCEGTVIEKDYIPHRKKLLRIRFESVQNGKLVDKESRYTYLIEEKYVHLLKCKKGNMRW